ncbi:hypothetical protein I6A84_10565 [Frankia sp. CNm7]|uniref:Uncharacterized protein n=1 Tax=Frankia nepalensis TaxID=1836974 RepID=A0A937RC09_9ACTN|nr:hypothetical protein [Frankia nepalensis]MBL7498041.1 hypothetical protein [Frankia nepalensis]MBL7513570.1 hypothetical protein [Frankia nepalensis]MBL7518541.1 hypothetical protein [Frankia nepalensis]MBL7629343.1 hypothetical protein [Frankia nepalensis]
MSARRTGALVVVLAVAVGAVVALGALREATESRSDAVPPGTASVVTVSLRSNQRAPDSLDAAALWTGCARTTIGASARAPGQLTWLGDGRFSVTVTPAIGEHGQRRLRGCLEDHRIDHLLGSVTSISMVPAAVRASG